MKRKLVIITTICSLSLGALVLLQAQPPCPAGLGGWHHGNPLEQISQALTLTDDQKAKIQPILDQAKPQIHAIFADAMQKTKGVMETTISQIRPLLSTDQQQKLDAFKKAHEDMANAMRELHDAQKK